jgi:parallel beta-helix repeat protein
MHLSDKLARIRQALTRRILMRHRFLTVGIGAAVLLAFPATSFGDKIDVFPGDSIQQAVNQASRGDVIKVHEGVYHQSVQIKKNGLTLKGAGADSDHGTVIKPKKTKRCQGGGAGICILSHKTGGKRARTKNTTIKGFLIRGFEGSGALAIGARNTTILKNKFADDGEYGAAAFSSIGTKFLHNVAVGAGVAGFYVGDSKNAQAILRGNKARGNGQFGFFLRDSSRARVLDNKALHNCSGIALINTGAPGGVHKWRVRDNETRTNNKFCKGEGEGPPISGTGIAVLGARKNVVRDNTVEGNRPRKASPLAGGIVVATFPGGSVAAHNVVEGNHAEGNEPADLVWDGQGTGNVFTDNSCGTSQPNGLCG